MFAESVILSKWNATFSCENCRMSVTSKWILKVLTCSETFLWYELYFVAVNSFVT
jgi:hypothetical protein